jgi:hypothetical protein
MGRESFIRGGLLNIHSEKVYYTTRFYTKTAAARWLEELLEDFMHGDYITVRAPL